MPRNMSFALTVQQIKAREKRVTRRFGWWNLKSGDIVCAVEKAMGIKPGEKVVKLCLIRIVSTRAEPLGAIDQNDCVLEGFPDYSPQQFISMLQTHYGKSVTAESTCNRIEFEYL